MGAYGRALRCHGLYARVHGEQSYLAGVHVHGLRCRHDGHDHDRVRKHGDDCDGDGVGGYVLVSRAYEYVRAHGHARGYGRVDGGVFLGSWCASFDVITFRFTAT